MLELITYEGLNRARMNIGDKRSEAVRFRDCLRESINKKLSWSQFQKIGQVYTLENVSKFSKSRVLLGLVESYCEMVQNCRDLDTQLSTIHNLMEQCKSA